jgi:hypothetical protein
MIEDLGGDPQTVEIPDERWFTPDEGRAWATKMVEYLRANPSSITNVKGVLSDLEEFRQVFEKAQAVGACWHLQLDA